MPPTRREWLTAAAGSLAAWGCSPPPSPERSAVPERTSVLERSFVIDLHCDTPMRIAAEGFDLGKRNDYGQVDIPRMREGGVSGVFFSVYMAGKRGPTPLAFEEANTIIDAVEAEVARHPDDLVLAASTAALAAAKQEGKIAVLLGIEGGHMIDSKIENLRRLYERGGRYMTLTHGRHTPWAGSSGDSPEEGDLILQMQILFENQFNDLKGMFGDDYELLRDRQKSQLKRIVRLEQQVHELTTA